MIIGSWIRIRYGTTHIRHQCRKTAVLSCHRCLINSGVKKWTKFKNGLELWPPDVRVNGGIQTNVYIFLKCAVPLSNINAFRGQCYKTF